MNCSSVIEHICAHSNTLAHMHTHTAGQPILRLFHNSSSCQSWTTAGCLLLLLEQYIKAQRARHLLPLSQRDPLSVTFFLPHLPFIFLSFFPTISFSHSLYFPSSPLMFFLFSSPPPLFPYVIFVVAEFFSFNSLNALFQTSVFLHTHVHTCTHTAAQTSSVSGKYCVSLFFVIVHCVFSNNHTEARVHHLQLLSVWM